MTHLRDAARLDAALRRRALLLIGLTLAGSASAGCGGDAPGGPRVDLIAEALVAVAEAHGDPVAYHEIAADIDSVDLVVANVDGASGEAALYRYDGRLTGPIEPRVDTRDTFTADQVAIDPGTIFEPVREELDDPAIVDFAVHVDGGVLVHDVTIASDSGGVILVLLGRDGEILGIQAR